LLICVNRIFRPQIAAGPLGCRSNPIRCHGPASERDYLDRLRYSDGDKPFFERLGSSAIPSPYGNIVDVNLIGFEEDGVVGRVYMDMHFNDYVEERPIRGFSLDP